MFFTAQRRRLWQELLKGVTPRVSARGCCLFVHRQPLSGDMMAFPPPVLKNLTVD